MKHTITFEVLSKEKYTRYIEVGTQAYNEHYLHLWPNRDSKLYIENSFTTQVLLEEENNPNTLLWLINQDKKTVGILKISMDCPFQTYTANESLYLDKIYLLKEATGKGIGSKALDFVTSFAMSNKKKLVWLGAMQKGKAQTFYLKAGFTIAGETQVPYKEVLEHEKKMYLMTKRI